MYVIIITPMLNGIQKPFIIFPDKRSFILKLLSEECFSIFMECYYYWWPKPFPKTVWFLNECNGSFRRIFFLSFRMNFTRLLKLYFPTWKHLPTHGLTSKRRKENTSKSTKRECRWKKKDGARRNLW